MNFIQFTGILEQRNSVVTYEPTFRIPLAVNAAEVLSDLANFVCVLDLSKLPASEKDHLFGNARSDGFDLRIRDTNLKDLPFELFGYDSGVKAGEVHFQVESLSSSVNSSLFLYYGDPSASAGSDVEATWGDYAFIAHDGFYESIGAEIGAVFGANETSSAQIGSGIEAGFTEFINSGLPYGADARIVSCWINFPGDGTNVAGVAYGSDSAHGTRFEINQRSDGTGVNFLGHFYGISSKPSGWHLVHGVIPGGSSTSGELQLYLNGSRQTETDLAGSSVSLGTLQEAPIHINSNINESTSATQVDEVRVSLSLHPALNGTNNLADWIATEYNNQSSQSAFFAVSPHESV